MKISLRASWWSQSAVVFSREPRGARFQLRSPTKRHSLETSPRNTKKKKKRRGFLCCSFAGGQTAELILAQGDFVQTLLEQGRPFEALPFGQNCVLFLILLIFSKLWLSKMTWQVFPVTVGPESTWHHQRNLKGNAAQLTASIDFVTRLCFMCVCAETPSRSLLPTLWCCYYSNMLICLHTWQSLSEDGLF